MRTWKLRSFVCAAAAVLFLAGASLAAKAEPFAEVQQALSDKGCYSGKIDGRWGPASERALRAFSEASGLTIARPFSEEVPARITAAQEKCEKPTVLSRLIPADVRSGLFSIPAEERGELCTVTRSAVTSVGAIQPKEKIEGLVARMDNAMTTYGFAELDAFTAAFNELATAAFVSQNLQLQKFALDALGRWAQQGAYEKTRNCSVLDCASGYSDAHGQDLAPVQDYNAVMDRVMRIAMIYYASLADVEPEAYAPVHATIRAWLSKLAKMLRNRNASKAQVFWGLGVAYNWFNVTFEIAAGNDAAVKRRLAAVAKAIDTRMLLKDGSLEDRTVRGNRALFYHNASLEELLVTLELLKANGIDLYDKLGERLDKSADILINGVEDPTTILPWAGKGYHNGEDGKHQDFTLNDFVSSRNSSSSWMYIYMRRRPGTPQAARLRELLADTAATQKSNPFAYLGLSCIYRVLDPQFREVEASGKSSFEASLNEQVLTFEDATVRIEPADEHGEEYKIAMTGAKVGHTPIPSTAFSVLADYPDSRKETESVRLLRLTLDVRNMVDLQSRKAAFTECGELASSPNNDAIRLHYGKERGLNACILRKLGPKDQTAVYSVYNHLDQIIAKAVANGGKDASKLAALFRLMSQ